MFGASPGHAIIGIVVVVLLLLQPVLGTIHHLRWRTVRRRTAWGKTHVWVGRTALLLGVINGGLGFILASDQGSWAVIVYAVFVAVVYVVYLAVVVFNVGRKNKSRGEKGTEIGLGDHQERSDRQRTGSFRG